MSHYFTDNSKLKKNRREITFRFLGINYTLTSDDGVFSKDGLDKGTEVLLETVLKNEIVSPVADLGCGIGVVGVLLNTSTTNLTVDGFDVNPRAVELANINYQKYKVNGKNIVNDGIVGAYNTVISNPPIRVGKEKLYNIFNNIYDSLNQNGSFYFVIRKQHGAKSAQAKCNELFGNCTLLKKDYGFYVYKSEKR